MAQTHPHRCEGRGHRPAACLAPAAPGPSRPRVWIQCDQPIVVHHLHRRGRVDRCVRCAKLTTTATTVNVVPPGLDHIAAPDTFTPPGLTASWVGDQREELDLKHPTGGLVWVDSDVAAKFAGTLTQPHVTQSRCHQTLAPVAPAQPGLVGAGVGLERGDGSPFHLGDHGLYVCDFTRTGPASAVTGPYISVSGSILRSASGADTAPRTSRTRVRFQRLQSRFAHELFSLVRHHTPPCTIFARSLAALNIRIDRCNIATAYHTSSWPRQVVPAGVGLHGVGAGIQHHSK
ncbi:hypothetical protein ABIB25_005587 [Nakamurella sp. UYEF19]